MSSASWRTAGNNKEKNHARHDHRHRAAAHGAQYIAPDAHGRNFYAIDRQFQDLLSLYMEPAC